IDKIREILGYSDRRSAGRRGFQLDHPSVHRERLLLGEGEGAPHPSGRSGNHQARENASPKHVRTLLLRYAHVLRLRFFAERVSCAARPEISTTATAIFPLGED